MVGWRASWLVLAALCCGGDGCDAGRSSRWGAPLGLELDLEVELDWFGLRYPISGGLGFRRGVLVPGGAYLYQGYCLVGVLGQG